MESVYSKNIAFDLNDNAYLYINYSRCDSVSVKGNDYVSIYDTQIKTLAVNGADNSKIIYSHDSKVGKTDLTGRDVEYHLDGVGDYSVRPDSASEITVTKIYR